MSVYAAGAGGAPRGADARRRVTAADLLARKREGTPIVMVTAYDFPSARITGAAGVDVVLVGDSAANVVLGYRSTRDVSVDEMLVLTAAARRGLDQLPEEVPRIPMLCGDLPFGSYEDDDARAVATARRFAAEAGCEAVKIEGGGAMVDRARAIIAAGIPVVGHVGLLPQSVPAGGEWKVQGRTAGTALAIAREALALQEAGCIALVFEAMPAALTAAIMPHMRIPVIGIGAGPAADGQVLVYHDLLGLAPGRAPRFVRRYAEGFAVLTDGVARFAADVRARRYPAPEHGYGMEPEVEAAVRKELEAL